MEFIISRCCTYSVISLLCSITVLGVTSSAFTQTLKDSPIEQTPSLGSNLIWPTQGILSQGFRKYQHEGIDIAGAVGTPIMAAASGTVVKAGWDDWGLGNFIEIKHPDGSLTVYGHNRRLLVSKGQQVNQGQVIAEMGSTGNSTAPHLHFEFHPDGRLAVDPLRLLPSSTVAKIPSPEVAHSTSRGHQASNSKRPVSLPPITQQVSPPQTIPVVFAPVSADTKCSGVTVIEGETVNVHVKVCNENGQLFYIGQLKQGLSVPIKIPAWNTGENRFRADNGSFSYFVSPKKVEVWKNGIQIRSDSFYTSNQL